MIHWAPDLVYEYPAPPSLRGVLWPQERATIKQIIGRTSPIGGAKANFLDKQTGTIKVGKRADLVVLNMNLFKVSDPTDLLKARVQVHHRQRQGPLRHAVT